MIKKILLSILIALSFSSSVNAQSNGCFIDFQSGYCYTSMDCLGGSVAQITSAYGQAVGSMCGTIQDRSVRLDICANELADMSNQFDNCVVTYNNQVNTLNIARATILRLQNQIKRLKKKINN